MASKPTINTGNDFSASFSTAPANGDVLYVKGTGATYTAGLSMPAVDLDGLYLQPTFTGDLGDETHHLDVTINKAGAGKLVAAWGGRFAHISGGTAAVIANVEMRPTKGGRLVLSACDVTTIIQLSGQLDLLETCDAETVRRGRQVHRRILVGVRHARRGFQGRDDRGPPRLCHRPCPGRRARDLRPRRQAAVRRPRGPAGGYVKYLGGTIPSLVGKSGGELDLTELTQPLTITAAELHEGFTIRYPVSGVAITWTAATVYGRDPRLPA